MSYDLVRRPALALFVESLGADPLAIGLIVSLSTVTGIFLKLPMGAISDIVNRRRLMIGGLLAFALPPFAYPFISDLSTLGTLRLLHGFATAIFTPLALATVAEMFSQRRGEALGWYTSATQGGGLLGPMLGGVLVYSIGFTPTFLTAGVIGALSVTAFFFIPKQETSKQRQTQSVKHMIGKFLDGLTSVVKHTGMLATSFTEAAKMMANGTLMAFLPLYGLSIGLNPAEIGLLFGIQALTSILSKPTMGRVSDRFGREPLILLGLCCCGGMIILMPQTDDFSLLLLLAGGIRVWGSISHVILCRIDRRSLSGQIDWGGYGTEGNYHGYWTCQRSPCRWISHWPNRVLWRIFNHRRISIPRCIDFWLHDDGDQEACRVIMRRPCDQ